MDLFLSSADALAFEITDRFADGCQVLNDHEFSMDESFKLSDAMSAIELMDAKMDSGMKFVERKLDYFLNNLKDALDKIGIAEVIAIFDASYSVLASWLNGQPPDQTLNTNLCFLVQPELLKQSPYLYTISCAVLFVIHLFKIYISTASIANEEDICLSTNSNHNEFDMTFIADLLKNSICQVNQITKSEESDALRLRLEYLAAFLELLNFMLPSVDLLIENPIDVETRFVPDLKRSNLLLAKCIQLNSMISDTICCGAQPSDGFDADFSWLSVFDANASLYSSLPSFPRKPRLLSRIDACKYFNDVLEKTLFITTNLPELSLTVEGIMNLLQRVGDQNSCILVRSIAQLLLMPNDHFICGTTSLADIVLNSISSSNWINETIEQSLKRLFAFDDSLRDIFNDFLVVFVRAYVNLFQTLGHNLSRQMDKFLRIIFEEFGALIIEANKIETALEFARMNLKQDNSDNQMPNMQHLFSNFFLQTILVLMHHHFSLAFRMRLIQPYEFHYIYWYFGEYVLKNLSNMCERVCNSLIFDFSRSTLHQQKKVSGKKRQQKTKIDNEFRKTLSLIKARSLYHRVETVMCQAMCNLSLGLIISRRMAIPSREHLRYAKRVEPFLALPPLLFYSYEEYLRESRITDLKANSTDKKCFENAAELFSQTIILMKNSELNEDDPMLATMASLHQVAKQNMVVAKLLATKDLEKKLSFEFPAEQINFPMIRLL
uniref:Protein MAK10 homolog n=1 Tax=Globodera rostochiensis TaxID=31243 RepID=A0A914HH79_GLORO